MNVTHTEIRVKGQTRRVPGIVIDNTHVVATGRWLKMATLQDEELHVVRDPVALAAKLKASPLKADVFTFAQTVPDVAPRYPYRVEWDNFAVVPITTYAEWWEKRATYDVRKAVKKAQRLGIVVKEAPFTDELVAGICGVYNESAVRQGTTFWHYQKDFEAVKRENGTFLERSTFIGAYLNDELVGFIKMVYLGNIASTMQVISQKRHFDKKPMNALIAKAIEMCVEKGVSHLTYGSYVYDGRHSSLTEFKKRNGFEQMLVPRYYVPISLKGRVAVALDLHHRLVSKIPEPIISRLRAIRSLWYQRKVEVVSEA